MFKTAYKTSTHTYIHTPFCTEKTSRDGNCLDLLLFLWCISFLLVSCWRIATMEITWKWNPMSAFWSGPVKSLPSLDSMTSLCFTCRPAPSNYDLIWWSTLKPVFDATGEYSTEIWKDQTKLHFHKCWILFSSLLNNLSYRTGIGWSWLADKRIQL